MATGYLQIQVRTAQDTIPLEGVQVRILDNEGNTLHRLTTDESGETPVTALETLDRSLSQDPGYAQQPYADYSVTVNAEGFQPLSVTEIPIYEDELATLPVALIPLQEQQTRRESGTSISIGPPAAAGSEPWNQQGTSEDARILRQVVIPNPITVHLGAPDSYAANVQTSFQEYVKNVASSEIYPTWPDAALRTNIYAIMTFALNRVYTEWYTGQGYSFDITNSTAYDQYYVPGHPIYDSISRIVDELFGEYVRRQGQNAPYFTSFCNGSTTSCPGLSQWGTVSLANQGYSPLQILRYYYPDDIEIAETNIVVNAPSSYPGTALRTGSTGLNVQTIQTYLNRIRQNYPAIPAITDPDGVFGQSTQAAVQKFQSIFNLTPDGIVGKATWYRISSLFTAVTRLAELDSEGNTLGIGTVPPSVTLRQGSGGQDVVTLQYLLNVLSQYDPGIPAPVQDGIFGSKTREAVVAFQRANQLDPDGIVGSRTWEALYRVYLGIQENVPMPGPDTGSVTYTVRAGDTLWLIARRYGTTVEAIKRLNGLSSNVLQIGQVLRIPVSQSPYVDYTVRAGDTLWNLARRYGTTVEEIMRINGLTSSSLQIGQVLRIPTG